jgi:hypothetical protein
MIVEQLVVERLQVLKNMMIEHDACVEGISGMSEIKLYTPDEVIRMLRFDVGRKRPDQTLYYLRRKGEIGFLKLAGRIYFTIQHVEEYLERNTVPRNA